MLAPSPKWSFAGGGPLPPWNARIVLLPGYVLGSWYCRDRGTGRLVWQNECVDANIVCGVDSGVVVAADMDDDATRSFCGIGLEDGQVRWTADGSAVSAGLLSMEDYVPFFAGGFDRGPIRVKDGKVSTFWGHGPVRDVRTGMPTTETNLAEPTASPFEPLRLHPWTPHWSSVWVADGIELRFEIAEGLEFIGRETNGGEHRGRERWRYAPRAAGRWTGECIYAYRIALPWLYLVGSEGPHQFYPHLPPGPPAVWRLTVLDLRSGVVAQDLRLGSAPGYACRIEDLDESGLLVSLQAGEDDPTHEILYFERQG